MTEPTLEDILVLYQKACTGVGGTCDKFPTVTKALADKIRAVVGNASVTLTGGQLVTACGFAGLFRGASALPDSCTDEELETAFTFESNTNIDDGAYVGLSMHITDAPEEGYQPLEPEKWQHREGEHG